MSKEKGLSYRMFGKTPVRNKNFLCVAYRVSLISLTILSAIGSIVLIVTTNPFEKFSKAGQISIKVLLISQAAALPFLSFLMISFKEIARKKYVQRRRNIEYPSSSEIASQVLSVLCSIALLAGLIINLVFSIQTLLSSLEKFTEMQRTILKISRIISLISVILAILLLLPFCLISCPLILRKIRSKKEEQNIERHKKENPEPLIPEKKILPSTSDCKNS